MRQFINGSPAAFHELEKQARRSCVRFQAQDMPPGCVPAQADVGFEIERHSGAAKLLVSKGVHFSGSDAMVGEWLARGEKSFADFKELVRWIRGPLADVYRPVIAADTEDASTDPVRDFTQLTDLAAVQEAMRQMERPLYLDEDKLRESLGKRVLGQEGAIRALAAVMSRHCARLRPARPAVLFAIGPSGVGKTRAAEALPKALHDCGVDYGYQFLRLDMSEYQESHRVSQLIGAPQGYIGHQDGSQLLDTLQASPRTIVLFDEIEKAHPAILRVLMNAMDAGRLSTAARSDDGHEVDCRRAVFIFTSNLDATEILGELESRQAFGNRAIEDEVCRRRLHAAGIAPEIVGRIGRFLVFRPLSSATRAAIMALAIAEVGAEYGLQIEFVQPGVIIELMRQSGSQSFGVRPERFLIDDALGGAFANAAEHCPASSLEVAGPPYSCRPYVPSDGAEDHSNSTKGTKNEEPYN